MNARIVTLQTRVTEIESPLPGSRAWVAKVIEEGEIKIGQTTTEKPAAWLVWKPIADKPARSQLLAIRESVRECVHNTVRVEAWPTDGHDFDAWQDGGYSWFGVQLTKAGEHLARQFCRKARTLLRLALRRQDRKQEGRFRVKIEAAH